MTIPWRGRSNRGDAKARRDASRILSGFAPRILVICALAFLGATMAACAPPAGQPTTVIIVRHGEKAAQPAADPPLTEIGQARAEALWEAVQDAGIQGIITTQLARTVQTAAPTATHLNITPDIVTAGGTNHAARIASLVKTKYAGKTVLIVGHSNTLPSIIAALGAKEPPAICDEAYDNFYVVTIAASGRATLLHSRFGVATPVGAGCASMM
jgi:broad specificity phosphatase PhoE